MALTSSRRRAILISPYFLPSNVAGVQRTRILAKGLLALGWEPIVLTVADRYYGEKPDPLLLKLLPADVRVIRVPAITTRLSRLFGVGDVSLRSLHSMRNAVRQIVEQEHPELIFVTVLPGYSSLVGAWAKRTYQLPFVLDYQDPWGRGARERESMWTKRGLADLLAARIEARVLPCVDAITAVSDMTLEPTRSRKLIASGTPVEVIPIGADRDDHKVARQYGRSRIADCTVKNIVYLGTITTRMLPAVEALFAAMAACAPEIRARLRLHLIGTSAQSDGTDQHGLAVRAGQKGVAENVVVHAPRVSYLDALRTMQDADLLMLVGSTDRHYTASKLFPYWLSEKPVLGLFHRESSLVHLAAELGGVRLVHYGSEQRLVDAVAEVTAALQRFERGEPIVPPRNEGAFDRYSSEGTATRYAELFDRVTRPRRLEEVGL